MAGWKKSEPALWIRGSIQSVQSVAADVLAAAGAPVPAPRDGLYSAAWHRIFRDALSMVATRGGTEAPQAVLIDALARWAEQGPRAPLTYLGGSYGGVTDEQARDVEVAWAWWAKLRGRGDATRADAVIEAYNRVLTGDRDEVLDAGAAKVFVGDQPPVTASRVWSVVGIALLCGVVGYVAHRQGRSQCVPGTGILDTGRRLASRAGGWASR